MSTNTTFPSPNIKPYEELAENLLSAYNTGDQGAVLRLNEVMGKVVPEQVRAMIQERLGLVVDEQGKTTDISINDTKLIVARRFGFADWKAFAQSFSTPATDARSYANGISTTPPFYKIDWINNSIEPGPIVSAAEWDIIFSIMKEYGISSLNAAGRMTDTVLKRISQLNFVTRLNLCDSALLTDDSIQHIANMPQLHSLDIGGWKCRLTDRSLEILKNLPALKEFGMVWQQGITDVGAANLSHCKLLENVNLMGTPTGDGAIRALAGAAHLRRLSTGGLVSDAGIPLLHQLPVFKTWQGGEINYGLMGAQGEPNHLLLDGPFTDKGLDALEGLDGIFGISFFWHSTQFTGKGLQSLATLPNLGLLGCEGERCTDEAMQYIAAIPNLRMLQAQGTVASDDGFEALSKSKTLEFIWGRDTPNFYGRGFRALSTMPSLRGIALSCKNVDDDSLATLPQFPRLTQLMPMDVTDEGFKHVGRVEQLENLWCMYCRDTTDVATAYLSGLKKLKTYYAGFSQITDKSLEILGGIESLEEVELVKTNNVTDAGLPYLAKLPRLRKVKFGGLSNVTVAGTNIFPPDVKVEYWAN